MFWITFEAFSEIFNTVYGVVLVQDEEGSENGRDRKSKQPVERKKRMKGAALSSPLQELSIPGTTEAGQCAAGSREARCEGLWEVEGCGGR